MGNLPALLANATPLVSDFYWKCQRNVNLVLFVNLENNFSIWTKFTHVYCSHNYSRISGKKGFNIEDKTLIIDNFLVIFFETTA
jgi:hypothetical protein